MTQQATENTSGGGKQRRYQEWSSLAQAMASLLSPARQAHVRGVVREVAQLCRRYGEDPVRGETAAWAHDAMREWPSQRTLRMAQELGIVIDEVEAKLPVLLHGPVMAAWMRVHWKVDDEGLLRAVAYHTTGRPEMGRLEQILYLADLIEPGREFPGVETLREVAHEDLDRACLLASESTLRYLLDRGELIHPRAIEMRNDLLIRLGGR